jgi:hypothetical protein
VRKIVVTELLSIDGVAEAQMVFFGIMVERPSVGVSTGVYAGLRRSS